MAKVTVIKKGQTDWHIPLNDNFKALEDRMDAVIDLIYPVGSIYMSVNSTDPSTLFGGTWVAWGSGRVPVGVNTADNDFKTVEKTGGEKSVQLTGENLPKSELYDVATWSNFYATGAFSQTTRNFDRTSSFGADFGGNRISMGGNVPHNNLQPYITCYMWKRTA